MTQEVRSLRRAALGWLILGAGLTLLPPGIADEHADRPGSVLGKQRLTFDAVSSGRVNLGGVTLGRRVWLPDGSLLERRERVWMKVDPLTDEAEPAFDAAAVASALHKLKDFDADEAAELAREGGVFTADRQRVLLRRGGSAYLYDFAAGEARKLMALDGLDEVDLSPRGGFLSAVRGNNLLIQETASGETRALTEDGSATRLNGILDWVYQEEVYGRGDFRAYWWSDDEQYVAFLQLDQTDVPQKMILHHGQRPQKREEMHYPFAGDPNPQVRLGVARSKGGEIRWVDLSGYAQQEILIVRVGWSPDGRVIFQVQDREQRWLHLNAANPQTGSVTRLIEETSPAWVNILAQPHWLKDGSFIWRSERDGRQHLYHYAGDGALRGRLTEGPWDVRDLHGVDEAAGLVYFDASRESPIERHAYRLPLTGGERPQRLTTAGSSHSVSLDPTFKFFFCASSNVSDPGRVQLCHADGRVVRVVRESEASDREAYALGETRLVRVPTPQGRFLNGLLVLPPDYAPGTRYPVLCRVYAGPAAPTVSNTWANGRLRDQLLATEGYVVWYCDPHSASNDGADSAWSAYQNLGAAELADIELGVQWLIEQGIADPQRIGIAGGSYGGYIVCYALTHSKAFKMGVSAFPVTDWRGYDSIYTERYMRTPQNNPQGYESSSALLDAENLHGRLLIYHGMIDENVHMFNTLQFIERLQRAGKQFDFMLYPLDRHGIGRGRMHQQRMEHDFILKNL